MVIAVDFDGTIVEHKYPEIGRERPFAVDVLKMLIAERHKLILWTVREGKELEAALKWCEERGISFYAVNSDKSAYFNEKRSASHSCKINADVFIDDCNIGGLPDWPTIYKIIKYGVSYERIVRKHTIEEMKEEKCTPPHQKWMFWKK